MHIVQTNGNTASTSPGRSLHRLPNRRAKVFPAPNCLRSIHHNVACHSGTVLRASLLSDFHIQRYCQWYGCSMAYFDKGRRGFGNSSKCRKKFGASLCFSSANFPANFVSVHFVWRFTANFVSVRGTETGGAQRRAASAKQLHFSSPHWPLVNNGGFLGKETVKR